MSEPGPTGAREAWQTPVMWVVALAGILTIGLFDFASGTELRVYPLYYLPISLLAWHAQRAGAVVAALLCALTWLYFNRLADMPVAGNQVWLANTMVNGVSGRARSRQRLNVFMRKYGSPPQGRRACRRALVP